MRRVLWLNGPFGVGKSTTAIHLLSQDPSWHLFDPEWVGSMLRANLHGVEIADFQDLHAWRTLVPKVAHEVAALTGRDLLAVQTVLNENYWRQIRQGMSALGLHVVHVLLDVDEAALSARIDADQNDTAAAGWRHDHVQTFVQAREWMKRSSDIVVDTSGQPAESVAAEILATLP